MKFQKLVILDSISFYSKYFQQISRTTEVPRCAIIKMPFVPKNGPELSSKTALHQHVQILGVFISFEKLRYEITVSF
jgi:hypothetical protein